MPFGNTLLCTGVSPLTVKPLAFRAAVAVATESPVTEGTCAYRPVVSHQQLLELRRELNNLVGAWHHQTGLPHGVIHADLRKTCGGPLQAQATAAELKNRIETLRKWAVSRG